MTEDYKIEKEKIKILYPRTWKKKRKVLKLYDERMRKLQKKKSKI